MKNQIKKVVSVVLSLIIVSNFILPLAALDILNEVNASDQPESSTANVTIEPKDKTQLQKELDDMVYEVKSLREENVKHFRLADGTYQAVVYPEPIHMLNSNGEWEDIDNSLSEQNGEIVTGNARVKFAKKITGNGTIYTLHEKNYKVTVGLNKETKKVEAKYNNTTSTFDENTTRLEKLTTLDNLTSTIVYSDILDGIDIEYVLASNSIKENIIVKQKSDSYTYTFTLELNGLTAKLDNGCIVLSDVKNDEVIYRIPAPYMYDAIGDISYNVDYTLEQTGNGKYEFTLTADQIWVNSAERVFPIVIDPSITVENQYCDTYVSSESPTVVHGYDHTFELNSSCEAYYIFVHPTLPDNADVIQAFVDIPYYLTEELDSSDDYISAEIYEVTSSWNEYYTTWNNKPTKQPIYADGTTSTENSELYYDSAGATNPLYATFTVGYVVNSWYIENKDNYGFAIKLEENCTDTVNFIAREANQSKATMTITYTLTSFEEGIYAIRNAFSYAHFEYTRSSAPSPLYQSTSSITSSNLSTSNLEELFKISIHPDTDGYIIRSMVDNSLVVYPNINTYSPYVGFCDESDSEISSYDIWNIDKNGNFYNISFSTNTTTYYICSDSTSNYTDLTLTTNPSDTGAMWVFLEYTGADYEDVEMEEYPDTVYVGDEFQFDAYMRSTVIGHNGPVSYSISNPDNSTLTRALINTYTGEFTALKPGVVSIRVTYPGAPWVWLYNITIIILPCSGYEEDYEPNTWNTPSYQRLSNCYNYALNKRNPFAVAPLDPGSSAEINIRPLVLTNPLGSQNLPEYTFTYISESDIIAAVATDATILGFTFNTDIGKNDVCPTGTYKVALVLDIYDDPNVENKVEEITLNGENVIRINPDTDYHWYRQNPDGTWSHKPGETEVTNLDASGELIYDPQVCDRDYTYDSSSKYNYEVFVGYFAVSPLE